MLPQKPHTHTQQQQQPRSKQIKHGFYVFSFFFFFRILIKFDKNRARHVVYPWMGLSLLITVRRALESFFGCNGWRRSVFIPSEENLWK